MQKETKQIIIYGAFGLLLGAKIVEVLFGSATSILDWWLLLMGTAAAIVHYLPTKDVFRRKAGGKDWVATGEDRLVLRDHPDPERIQAPAGNLTGSDEQLVRW